MLHQTMSAVAVQQQIDKCARIFGRHIAEKQWTIESAKEMLKNGELTLFETAGLAKAIACFDCVAEPCPN